MYGKTLFFILLLGGVAVLPYLMSDDKWLGRIEEMMGQAGAVADDAKPNPAPSTTTTKPVKTTTAGKVVSSPFATASPSLLNQQTSTGLNAPTPYSSSVAPQGPVGVDIPLPHLLSFQATPEWITQNWERVTNRVGELDLQGWRVPYFRSVRDDDFAGSVTYYFDRARRVQRIVLHGYTSDANEFVQLATGHYQMQRVHSPEGDLYVANVEKRPLGAMHLCYAPLLTTKNKARQCELLMELNRKGTEYGMSHEFERLIQETQNANQMLTPISPANFQRSSFLTPR